MVVFPRSTQPALLHQSLERIRYPSIAVSAELTGDRVFRAWLFAEFRDPFFEHIVRAW